MGHTGTQTENAAIDTTDAVLASVTLRGKTRVEVVVRATASATFALDVRADSSDTWLEDNVTYDSVTAVDDVLQTAAGEVRLRVKTAAAGGETADVMLTGAG